MRLVLLGLLAGCYAPSERDCTVTCDGPHQCASGQVCGGDGFCAAPGVAGHCSTVDASVRDAEDVRVPLHVQIDGHGAVAVLGVGTCRSDLDNGDCTYEVPVRVMRMLTATQIVDDKAFIGWMDGCMGVAPSCALAPVMPMTHVGAKFQ